jgi:transcriptional regulator with XRE-family HTH domain
VGVGRLIRALRIRRRWRQADLADAAGISRRKVSRLELGHIDRLSVTDVRAACAPLEVRLPFAPSWHGGDADRIVNERHTRLQQRVSELLASAPGWSFVAEATFSIFGERGAIDLLGWHAASRAVLVVELKSEIVDPSALVRQVDRYRRLAPRIARERGWDAAVVGAWVAVLDTSMNRRRLAKGAAILRAAFPTDGRAISGWIARPSGPLAGLSFVAISHSTGMTRDHVPTRRVRKMPAALRAGSAGSERGQ